MLFHPYQNSLIALRRCFFLYGICFYPNNIFTAFKTPLFEKISPFVKMIRGDPQEYKGRRICQIFNVQVQKLLKCPGFIMFRILIIQVQLFGSFLIFLPRWVTINQIKFAKRRQIILFQVLFDENCWMVSLLYPYFFLLHQLLSFRILIVSFGRIHAFDKVLRSFTCFNELSIESSVLFENTISLNHFIVIILNNVIFCYQNDTLKNSRNSFDLICSKIKRAQFDKNKTVNYNFKQSKIKPMSMLASQTLQKLLEETATHPKIKQTLKLMTITRQKITYHALVSSQQTYLQLRGLANHDQEEFNYINKMLHSRIVGVMGKIKRKQLQVRDIEEEIRQEEQQRDRQQNAINQQIMAEVEHVINNVDLPLSLFKRNDKYWYHDNPKTIEAKNYVYERIKQDRQRKKKIKSEMMKKETERQKQERERMQRQSKEQEQKRKRYHEQVKNKIENYKRRSEERQKNIQQSQKYISSLKPLFVKIQEKQQSYRGEALQQQKKRLSELRKLHKSIDYAEIQQHKNRILQMQKQREIKKIFNEPVKVSYKSQYHKSMTASSRIGQYETTQSLYEKKKEYGNLVKNQFKPKIDQNLVEQMEQRLKLMRRKRVRKNPKKKAPKQNGDDEDDDQDDDEQVEEKKIEQTKKQQPIQNSDQSEDQDDEDEQKKKKRPRRIRGQDEDPDRSERYDIGVQYLQYARKMAKKGKQGSKVGAQSRVEDEDQNKSEQQMKKTERYKDYLKQMTKTNRSLTIDHIDTKRMKDQYNKSIVGNNDYKNLSQLQNETRMVETKINRQEQLLRFKKLKNEDAVAKKVEIDNAVIETIKARLALMGN